MATPPLKNITLFYISLRNLSTLDIGYKGVVWGRGIYPYRHKKLNLECRGVIYILGGKLSIANSQAESILYCRLWRWNPWGTFYGGSDLGNGQRFQRIGHCHNGNIISHR